MSSENILDKVKKLRELTGVGFKDCKNALDENNGDIEKSIDYLRKKGIAKASKKMERVAADGLVCICEKNNNFSMIEINCETDFVAKNSDFIKFCDEISELAFINQGKMEEILNAKMENKKIVKDSLVDLISKIGEKINIRRSVFANNNKTFNFSYTHTSIKKNVGKLGVLLSIETNKDEKDISEIGKQIAMHIAASSPLAIEKNELDQNIINKEKEIITEELKNSGKDSKIIDKIAEGKLNKFINDNTLLNQEWIMEPKRKVKDVLKDVAGKDTIKIKSFTRFKVGEGI
tara:strand:- start:607 stop:1476 length:870 start_codon:yes stop_codon:yes gene_type:complete